LIELKSKNHMDGSKRRQKVCQPLRLSKMGSGAIGKELQGGAGSRGKTLAGERGVPRRETDSKKKQDFSERGDDPWNRN